MKNFILDPQLERDSSYCANGPLSQIRLMNDRRFPWLLLIPQGTELREITDLNQHEQQLLLKEINVLANGLRDLFPAVTKLNIAALGNMVAQLHIHIIGRHAQDAAWPKPVWGQGQAEPYPALELQQITTRIQTLVGTSFPPQS